MNPMLWTCANGHQIELSNGELPSSCPICNGLPTCSKPLPVQIPDEKQLPPPDEIITGNTSPSICMEVPAYHTVCFNPEIHGSPEPSAKKVVFEFPDALLKKNSDDSQKELHQLGIVEVEEIPPERIEPKPVEIPPAADVNQTMDYPGVLSSSPTNSNHLNGTIQEQMKALFKKKDSSQPNMASTISTNSDISARIQIPGYEVLGELGRGGMGVVYKARQIGLNRIVAIKMILSPDHAGPEQIQRFVAEAEAVAKLQHVNIVQIYEIGQVNECPFFSLEYIDGGNLAEKLNSQPQAPRVAASVMEEIAQGVVAAHEVGIVHRDLKPANIMLGNPLSGVQEAQRRSLSSLVAQAQHPFGVPKITDFGLAKRLEGGVGQTQMGAILGTPAYMSPEQAAGRTQEISESTDIYSLGAILYEILTGRPPFLAPSPMDTIMQVLRDEPIPPTQIQPKIPRDLEIICLKCLEKSPRKRYPSVYEFALDLRRFLNGDPIAARPATRAEKVNRWIRRHPATSGLLASGIMGLLALISFAWIYHQHLEAALELAQSERDKLAIEKEDGLRRTVRLMISNGTKYVDRGEYLMALPWFAEAIKIDNHPELNDEMHRIRLGSLLRRSPRLVQAWFHQNHVHDTAFSADGKLVATACSDGSVRLFKVEDTQLSEPLLILSHPEAVHQVLFSPDMKYLASLSQDNLVRLWERKTGALKQTFAHDAKIHTLSFDPLSTQILTASEDRTAKLWDIETGKSKRIGIHAKGLSSAEFSNDGTRIVTGCKDGTARVWDEKTGLPVSAVMVHQDEILHARFSQDDTKILTASRDHTARIWDSHTGKPIQEPIRRNADIIDAIYSPNQQNILIASTSGNARIWDVVAKNWRNFTIHHDSPILDIEFSPDGLSFATSSDDNTARVWDTLLGTPLTPPLHHNGGVNRVTFSPDGSSLLTASQDGVVRLWDLTMINRHENFSLPSKTQKAQNVYSPDRRKMLKIEKDRVQIYDSATNQPMLKPLEHRGKILHCTFRADGKLILTTSMDRTAQVWDAETGDPVGEPKRHGSEVVYGTFSPDGKRLATASTDNSARIWDTQTGLPVTPVLSHPGTVERVAFSPDSRCVLSYCQDGFIRIWEVETGESLTPPQIPTAWMNRVLEDIDYVGWDLPPDQRSAQQLELLALCYSGHRIDRTGSLVSLDGDSLQLKWRELCLLHPDELERPTEDLLRWHQNRATHAEQNRDWFALEFHLNRLIEQSIKEDAKTAFSLYIRRGNSFAERARWQDAAIDFDKAINLQSNDETILTAAALCHLAAHNEELFRKRSDTLMKTFGPSAHGPSAYRLAWIACLKEDHTDLESTLESLTDTISSSLPAPSASIALGSLLIQQKKWQEAEQKLRDGLIVSDPIDAVRAWLLLAYTLDQEGNKEAKLWLRQANHWINHFATGSRANRPEKFPRVSWIQRLELMLLRDRVEKKISQGNSRIKMEKIEK